MPLHSRLPKKADPNKLLTRFKNFKDLCRSRLSFQVFAGKLDPVFFSRLRSNLKRRIEIPQKRKSSQKRLRFFTSDLGIKWLQILCFFSLAFSIFYFQIGEHLYMDIFTQRDISRAMGWLKGQFYWHGPEMTQGNNLPGPFFYFLLFPPLLFGESPMSQSVLWLIAWLSLSWTAVFYFAGKICKRGESLLLFIMLFVSCAGESLFLPLSFAWNPAFAILFHILSLMALYYWRETRKNSYLYLLGLLIGFGIQTHFLISAHFATALLLYIFRPRETTRETTREKARERTREKTTREKTASKKTNQEKTASKKTNQQKKINLAPGILFISLIALPNLPYLIMWAIGAVEVSTFSLDRLAYLKEDFFSDTWIWSMNKMTSFKFYWAGPFALALFLIAWRAAGKNFLGGSVWKSLRIKSSALPFIVILPVSVTVAVAVEFWYLYFLPPFLSLLFLKFCDGRMSGNQNKNFSLLLAYGVLLAIPLLKGFNLKSLANQDFYSAFALMEKERAFIWLALAGALSSVFLSSLRKNEKKYFYRNLWKLSALFLIAFAVLRKNIQNSDPFAAGIDNKNMVSLSSIEPAFRQIAMETNWDAKTAMKRIYFVGGRTHSEISWISYYSIAKERAAKERAKEAFEKEEKNIGDKNRGQMGRNAFSTALKRDGYFVIQDSKQFANNGKIPWKRRLSQSSFIPPSIQKEINEGRLVTGPSEKYGRFYLIPYKAKETSLFPEGFYNLGQPYYWEEPDWLKNCGSTGAFTKSDGFYYCITLPGHLQRAGIFITRLKPKKRELIRKMEKPLLEEAFLEVSFFGPLLGSKSLFSNMDGFAFWSNIRLSAYCGKKEHSRALPNIGFPPDASDDNALKARPLNSPLKLRLKIRIFSECGEKGIDQIKLRFNLFQINTLSENILENKEILWKIL